MAPAIDVGHYGLNVRRPLSGRLAEKSDDSKYTEFTTVDWAAAFLWDLGQQTTETAGLFWEGLIALQYGEARQAFKDSWSKDRVEPLGERFYSLSNNYSGRENVADWTFEFALIPAVTSELLQINAGVESYYNVDLVTGDELDPVDRTQRALFAFSSGVSGATRVAPNVNLRVPRLPMSRRGSINLGGGQRPNPVQSPSSTYEGPQPSLNSVAYHEYYRNLLRQREAAAPSKGGGPYDKVRAGNTGGQVHHTPAAKVTPFEYRKAPSVWMETADHRKTASWGSSKRAETYRAKQDALINSGKLREAIQMDIDDIRSLFGNKYDANIKQMLKSFGFSE